MAEQRTLDAERARAIAEEDAYPHPGDNPHASVHTRYTDRSLAFRTGWAAALAYVAKADVARRAPPALDAEGLPPLIWGDDLEAWLEVRDEAEIVAAIRAAQRHAYDAGQQSQAARIQHLTHERDLALAAARQSAPEGAPVVKIQRGRVWIVRGNQSFMLAYEADDDEPENVEWYASKLRSAIACFTPGVKVEGAPVGMVLVPVEPTDEMVVAFAETWFSKVRPIDDCGMEDCYAAMIEAAPTSASAQSSSPEIPDNSNSPEIPDSSASAQPAEGDHHV